MAFKNNEYSYEGFKYTLEKTKKSPLSQIEDERCKKLTAQMKEAKFELKKLINQQNSKEALEEAIKKIREDAAKEIEKNGTKSKEELEKEYIELYNQFVKVTKKSKK